MSWNPARPSQIVGTRRRATVADADHAVEAAYRAFSTWRRVDPEERARYLLRTAAILRNRIYEFSAWMTYEVSKSWLEAYADTAEAIDFLEFYAREMIRLSGGHPTTQRPAKRTRSATYPWVSA